jgi:hypothetical protein
MIMGKLLLDYIKIQILIQKYSFNFSFYFNWIYIF